MGVSVREKNKGSGVWWVFLRHPKIPGGRASRKVGEKVLAEKVADQLDARLKTGQFDQIKEEGKPEATIPTFENFAAYFMQTYSKHNHKESTAKSYQEIIDNHLKPEFGKKQLDKIKKADVKKFLYKKQETKSVKTTHICRQYLSCILGQAVDDEIILINPAAKTAKFIKTPAMTDDEVMVNDPLNWEEKELLEQAVKMHYPKYYVFMLTAIRTGMRIGELIALKPEDLDFNSGVIFIRRNAVRGVVGTPKSGKGRKVKMSPQLKKELKKHLIIRKQETLKNGWGDLPEFLFYNQVGKLVDINNFRNRVFYKALEKAELRQIHVHDIRHTYATLRIKAGHNIADVSKALGHSSIKITIDIYYHDMPEEDNSDAADLDSPAAPKKPKTAPKRHPAKSTNKKRLTITG